MEQVMLTEEVRNKWQPVLDLDDAAPIQDRTEANNLIRILETTQTVLQEETNTGDVQNWDPILINMIRRTQPSLVSNRLMGVQPMNGPTGLVFFMRVHYKNTDGTTTETFNQEAPDTSRSGPMGTRDAENLGQTNNSGLAAGAAVEAIGNPWAEMSFSIEKTTVTAETRAMKARYTRELEHDLRKMHGADAGAELVNILRTEITAEIDRENLTRMRDASVFVGTFDLDADTDGRWEAEKVKGLAMFVERQANKIAVGTRRGKGNFLVTSANVAGALDMIGRVDSSTAIGQFEPNPVGPSYVGKFAGRYDLYVDPYQLNDEVIIGYKGASEYDAGLFICPYVGLELARAVGEEDFQPRIGFKTRYGVLEHPFATVCPTGATYTDNAVTKNEVNAAITDYLGWRVFDDFGTGTDTTPADGFNDTVSRPGNQYFRRFTVTQL